VKVQRSGLPSTSRPSRRMPSSTARAVRVICVPETAPILHFSKRLDVLAWPPRTIGP
jgi:hypothetical protein